MSKLLFANGDAMPKLGLGTWLSEPGLVEGAVTTALDIGYRHIDCARAYGNEAEVGRALARAVTRGVSRRDLWVTSKLWNNAHDPDRVLPALKQSLADLKLDYLDLYLMHWPIVQKAGVGDPESASDLVAPGVVPLRDTWEAMEQCADAGLVTHLGVANFSRENLAELLGTARITPEVNQVEMHPYLQQRQLHAFCDERGIAITAYSPLGSRGRPERLRRAEEPTLLLDDAVQRIAVRHSVPVGSVVLSWIMSLGVAAIPKSTRREHIADNFSSLALVLSPDEMEELRALDRSYRYGSGSAFTLPGSGYTYEWLWGSGG